MTAKHLKDLLDAIEYDGTSIKTDKKERGNMNLADVKVVVGKETYIPNYVDWEQTPYSYPKLKIDVTVDPHQIRIFGASESVSIKEVIFNPPATIVFWSDGTKTVVKADYGYDNYDPEKGIAMAISKKMLGDNKYEYYNVFKHWLKKWNKQQKDKEMVDYLEKHLPEENEQ